MRARSLWLPLAAGLVALLGSLGTTLFLDHSAMQALDRVLSERLTGAGESAAALMGSAPPTQASLRTLMQANALDGAYVFDPGLRIAADATGAAGRRVDLLRVDLPRARRALEGSESVGKGYQVDGVDIAVGYFPLRAPDGSVSGVLALEAGQAFARARVGVQRARWIGIGLSVLLAAALAVLTLRWAKAEAARSLAAEKAARGEMLQRVAAMAAHEIRNPLGVIRGTVDLMRERAGPQLGERDREALQDVLGEVERLRRLTEDLLDLSADRALQRSPMEIGVLVSTAGDALHAQFPAVELRNELPAIPLLDLDTQRIHQVFTNLFINAAQAGAQRIVVRGEVRAREVRLEVADDGPGVPPALRERLFEPFVTGKATGTGIGLALSRRILERHDGALVLRDHPPPGCTFELTLPRMHREPSVPAARVG